MGCRLGREAGLMLVLECTGPRTPSLNAPEALGALTFSAWREVFLTLSSSSFD